MTTQTPTRGKKAEAQAARARRARRRARTRLLIEIGVGTAVAAALLFAIFNSGSGTAHGGGVRFQVGQPAAGAPAPPVVLDSTAGGQFNLAAASGKTVLLYFQEGVGCQPCWNQIRDIEHNQAAFKALGIDEMVSITGNDLSALKQKVRDENLQTPVLSDPGLTVSKTYHANDFGMMGTGADGHTFIVVGADGTIRWRADYGGAPNFTMYVSVPQLVSDIQQAGLARR